MTVTEEKCSFLFLVFLDFLSSVDCCVLFSIFEVAFGVPPRPGKEYVLQNG